jgi:hypothetical protein
MACIRVAGLPLAAVAIAAVAAGCAAEMAMLEPEPFVILSAVPADGSTAWGGRDITVVVEDPGHLVTEQARADLGEHVFIHTWPDDTAVPVSTENVPGPTDWQWGIRVTPAVSLDDHWYVVGASELPGRALLKAKLPDGTFGARFRPGSHPRVASLQLCDDPPDGVKVIVTFSEPVSAAGNAADLVSVALDGRSTRCTSTGVDPGVLTFACAERASGASGNVSLAAGLASFDGVPLEAGSWPIQVTQLPHGGCQAVAPPL